VEYRVVILCPRGYEHSLAFAEVAETLIHGLRGLGHAASGAINHFSPTAALNIVLGAHLLGEDMVDHLPANTVLYNLEQVEDALFERHPALTRLFSRYEVWDYSVRNMVRLESWAPRLFRLPVGTMPALTRIVPVAEQDIDVLFYGATNDRREALLAALTEAGLTVHAAFSCYGSERDRLIARAKIVLNIHKHAAQIFEIVRVSYLLANRKAVVSEIASDTDIDTDLVDAVWGTALAGMVESCARLIAEPATRGMLAERGYQRMVARRETDYLRALFQARRAAGLP
jgi:hypothetical protein